MLKDNSGPIKRFWADLVPGDLIGDNRSGFYVIISVDEFEMIVTDFERCWNFDRYLINEQTGNLEKEYPIDRPWHVINWIEENDDASR